MSEAEEGPARPPRAFWRTVRFRLLLIALLPMLVVLPVLLGTTVSGWVKRFDELTIAKVNSDLTIAHQHLAGLLESRRAAITALGQSHALAELQSTGDAAELAGFLDAARQRMQFDFLYFVDRNDGEATQWPVVQQAIAGQDGAVIDIFSAEVLARIDPALAAGARLPLVPTEAAVPTDRTQETRGMVVHAATPTGGGALVGGVLLNRNLAVIDRINELVYPDASLIEGSQGTVTLFLEDVRISTNVRLFENVRALGTRVSAAVRMAVLDEGQVWLDRAFVVNDWYVSAYEPIIDSFGTRVGMLYVGFLDQPFLAAKRRTLLTVAGAFLLSIFLSVPIFLRWARSIFSPLERMNAAIHQVERGDLGARSKVRADTSGGDEITHVAAHLDLLLDQLQERDARLRGWAEELETHVAARTADLQHANRQLEATTRQLIVSEKLAAIGEITAGVAHEINNPIAVIQGNLDVIHDDLGPRTAPLKTEFNLIQQQIQKVHVLISKLLQFARPEEYADSVEGHAPDDVIRDSLPLVQHLLNRGDITLDLGLAAGRSIQMNRTELQQVLVNLIVNAVHAMPDGGTLSIGSRVKSQAGDEGIEITVKDTGQGMEEQVLARIFDPFFTTKQGDGTGLGLSISRKLIDRAGGAISAQSTPGQGTVFSIWLPAASPALAAQESEQAGA